MQYKLRDWLFSRQRYWGEPIPVVHAEDGEVVPVLISDLPITLPAIDEYAPDADGQPPLARASKDWLELTLPDGRKAWRETNTMPQWGGSCWYYLRYIDAKNSQEPWDLALEKSIGCRLTCTWAASNTRCCIFCMRASGTKFFSIAAWSPPKNRSKNCSIKEWSWPTRIAMRTENIITQAMWKNGKWFARASGTPVETQIEKMSKSRYNVFSPDEVIDEYGADAMRLYELFMGPLDATKPWQMDGVEGVYRFLNRVWRLFIDEETGQLNSKLTDAAGASEPALWKMLHKTIKKVSEDTASLQFNTAISQMMIFVNGVAFSRALTSRRETLKSFLKLLSIYAPHLGEELWARMDEKTLLCQEPWPQFDAALCIDDTVTIAVQVNGKLRDTLQAKRDMSQAELQSAALALEKVQSQLAGSTPANVLW